MRLRCHWSVLGLAIALLAGCVDTRTTACPNGLVCPEGTRCAANQLVCISDDCGDAAEPADGGWRHGMSPRSSRRTVSPSGCSTKPTRW